MYKCILVPVDGSALSLACAEAAAEFTKDQNATAILVSVVQPYSYTNENLSSYQAIDDYDEAAAKKANEWIAQAALPFKTRKLSYETALVRNFSPADGIVDCAIEKHCDCIFIASRGRDALQAALLGSTTLEVLNKTQIPVLVYR